MDIELGRVLRAIRRFWWTVVVAALAFTIIAALIWIGIPKSYTASSTLIILPSEVSGSSLGSNSSVSTYIQMVESDSVLAPVAEEFEPDKTTEELRAVVQVSNIPGTNMILIQVTDSDPQRAAEIANAVTESFSGRAESLTRTVILERRDGLQYERDQVDAQLTTTNARIEQIDADDSSTESELALQQLEAERLKLEQRHADIERAIRVANNQLILTQPPALVSQVATPPERANGLSIVLLAAAGFVVGALVGTGIMLWLELRDRRIRDVGHLSEITGLASVMSVRLSHDSTGRESALRILASRIAGHTKGDENASIVLAWPRDSDSLDQLAGYLKSQDQLRKVNLYCTAGLLDQGLSNEYASANAKAIVLVEKERTRDSDVVEVMNTLDDIGVPAAGVVVLE